MHRDTYTCFLYCFLKNNLGHMTLQIHITYGPCKAIWNTWICVSVWCLGVSQFNGKKILMNHIFYLQFSTKKFFDKNDYRQWKTHALHNNAEQKRFWGKLKASLYPKKWVLCLNSCKKIRFNLDKYCSQLDQLKGSNWWKASIINQLEVCYLPYGQ